MPCLNEARTVGACVALARSTLDGGGIDGEVVVADNGSSDGSVGIARANGARVVVAPRRGYGEAVRAGIAAAEGRYVIVGDADGSYDWSAVIPFVVALRNGADLVMGNRFRGGVAPGAMPMLHRYVGSPAMSLASRVLFGTGVGDINCGLRGVAKDAVERLALETSGMELASEMIVNAAQAGLRIVEVPTTLQPDGRGGPPHLRTWRDGLRHLSFFARAYLGLR